MDSLMVAAVHAAADLEAAAQEAGAAPGAVVKVAELLVGVEGEAATVAVEVLACRQTSNTRRHRCCGQD